MSRLISTSIAVLAAAAALSSSVASAAPKAGAKHLTAKRTASTKTVAARAKRFGTTTTRPGTTRPGVVYVKATATGKGPAKQSDCDAYAADIETADEALADYMIEGDDDRAEGMYEAIKDIESRGTKAGCTFMY